MDFIVSQQVFTDFPDLAIGVVIATNIDNMKASDEIADELKKQQTKVAHDMDSETFKEHPNIAAMQEVHRSFGNNPNKNPPSIQALVKRIVKGGELRSINPIVDLYNIISLKHVICAGAEDTDACAGDIRLDYANGSESFLPLGEDREDPPNQGELVYKDDAGVICRRLNWREGDRTKITENTKNAVIVIEGFPPFSRTDLEDALNELSALLQKHCNAQTRIEILTSKNNQCSL